MREVINNLALAFILAIILFALLQIAAEISKQSIPIWIHILVGVSTNLYVWSRKENWE